MENKRIYLDYMASTPLDAQVKDAMEPYWSEVFAHPWSLHQEGVEAKKHLEENQKKVAELLSVRPNELIFTGSGTEANSLALRGVLEGMKEKGVDLKGKRVIISSIEHPSVAGIASYAKREGMQVDRCPITKEGIVDLVAFKELLSLETVLVSVMYVNSEIGTIQPLASIAKLLRPHEDVVFHSDASQAPLYLDCTPQKLGVDLLVLDGHKMYGPKGVGMLFVKEGVKLAPLFLSEKKDFVRPGTPPLPLIAGFRCALELAIEEREERAQRVRALRDHFIDSILTSIDTARLNGGREKRVPHNVSFSFEGENHEFLLLKLDKEGVAASTRSACLSSGREGSHVLEALHDHYAPEAIRFSLGKETTKDELDRVTEVLKKSLS